MLLWGGMLGSIAGQIGFVGMDDFLRAFHVPAGVRHAALIDRFTIFLNWEKWRGVNPVTSAADDFTAV